MLPMFDKKKTVGLAISRRAHKEGFTHVKNEAEAPESKMHEDLKNASESLLKAIESKSVHEIGAALKAAHAHLDGSKHEEGEHTDKGDLFDAIA